MLETSARRPMCLLKPVWMDQNRRGSTRPGSLLRQGIPIRGPRTDGSPGWLEMVTLAMCGERLDDLHVRILNEVHTPPTGPNCEHWQASAATSPSNKSPTSSRECPSRRLEQTATTAVSSSTPPRAHFSQPQKPVLFTRSRPYHKNENAHVERHNYTHVSQHFGYERSDNPADVCPCSTPTAGAR